MLIEISCGGETTRTELKDGAWKVGSSASDEVRIPGLPPSLLTLRIDGTRLTVTSNETVSIGKSMFPSHVPRLVIAGEVVRLARAVTVMQVPPKSSRKGTAAVMKELLSGTCAVEHTQAATLTVLTGPDSGNVIPLAFEQMLIGRGEDCTLQIRDRSVSRRHARLVLKDTKAIIEDLRGANGTYVNGTQVKRRATLTRGDVIELGQTILRYDAPPGDDVKTPEEQPSVVLDRSLVVTAPYTPAPQLKPPSWLALSFAGGAVAVILGVAAALTALF